MHRPILPRPFHAAAVGAIALLGALLGCEPVQIKVDFRPPSIDLPRLPSFTSRSEDPEPVRVAPAITESAPDSAIASGEGSIIGGVYPLDRWSVPDLNARLERNQRAFDRVVGDKAPLLKANPLWETAASPDLVACFDSDELRALQRLDLEYRQLLGLLDAHRRRANLRSELERVTAELARKEADGVDRRGQEQLGKKRAQLQGWLKMNGEVMLAGRMGTPPLGETKTSVLPIALGEAIEGIPPAYGGPEIQVAKTRGIDAAYAGGRVHPLLLWPSGVVGGAQRLTDVRRPEVRLRVLVDQAGKTAEHYSQLLGKSNAKQHAYFRECMELCKRIAACAQAGDMPGVDAARAVWIQESLGGLLAPVQDGPVAQPAESEAVPAQPTQPTKAAPIRGGAGIEDYKDGVLLLVDLDKLSLPEVKSLLDAARKRLAALAGVNPPTAASFRGRRMQELQIELGSLIESQLRKREQERALQAKAQEEVRRGEALGLKVDAQRRNAEQRQLQLSRERYVVVWATSNQFGLSAARSAGMLDGASLGGVDHSVLFGPSNAAGMRPIKQHAQACAQKALELHGSDLEIAQWLASESSFYDDLAEECDALRKMKGGQETAQYRQAAKEIDDKLRSRCLEAYGGFFDAEPAESMP